MGTWTNHEPRRKRKMLLNRDEIRKISIAVQRQGFTMVPLSLYFKDGRVKVEIGLARGRKSHDKRQALAERDASREMSRAQGRRSKGMVD
jgi:SsrA-binding protein